MTASDGPIRTLTRRQAEIAHGIGRNLSYREIGEELGLGQQTVAGYVKAMALIFDSEDAFPPRQRIFVWVASLATEEWTCIVAGIMNETGLSFAEAKARAPKPRIPTPDELITYSSGARKRYMASLHGAGVAGEGP